MADESSSLPESEAAIRQKPHRVPIWKQQPKRMGKKFWAFLENPIFWGGVGVLVGAIGVAFSLKVIFVASGIVFSVAIVRNQFFEGCKPYQRRIGNLWFIAIMSEILFVTWHFTPKARVPTTADEIAAAVMKRLHEDVRPVSGVPPAEPKTPMEVAKKPSLRPPPKQTTLKEAEPNPPAPPPPQLARLIVSQRPQVSTREDAPYKTEVTIQTTSEFPSLKLVVQCDKPLVDGGGGFAGVMMMTTQGIVKDHTNVYVFTYQSASPPFGPQNPIILNLWSKESVKCEAATF